MVMHARKPLKRISDGYFEKHQAHPYQKYSKSDRRAQAEYGSSDSRYTPLRSPNGNVSHGHSTHPSQSSHGHHHYSHVVDERGYSSSRNSYLPKGSEKERDRDYKSSRNKYTESVRSPKERSKDVERERSNHERNESQPEKKSRTSGLNVNVSRSSKYDKRTTAAVNMPPGSEWSEHISSLGKRYYYNCITEVSQWEKPRDLEARRTASKDSTYSSRSRLEDAKKPPDWDKKHREKRSRSRSGRREAEKPSSKRPSNQSERYWNNSNSRDNASRDNINRDNSNRDNSNRDNSNRDNSNRDNTNRDNTNRDNSNRDNSSRDNSTRDNRDEEVHERTRPKHSLATHDGKDGQSLQDMDISPDRSTPISENSYGAREASAAAARAGHADSAVPPVVVLDNSNLNTGSLLAAALPRIAATPLAAGAGAGANGGASPQRPPSAGDTPPRDPGPPTPTHSENTDPHAPPLHLEQALPRKMECLGSYSSVVGGALHHAAPMLSQSLLNHVRTDLTAHVTGWPADILEKQAIKFTEEAYQLGCLQCTRVSSELKCSRSLVRHTEIQATLQEQKIMYLRQQISRLEELKSQNSFMSDE